MYETSDQLKERQKKRQVDFVATLQNKKKATILGLLEILQFLKYCLTFTDINTGTHNIDLKKKIDKKNYKF